MEFVFTWLNPAAAVALEVLIFRQMRRRRKSGRLARSLRKSISDMAVIA